MANTAFDAEGELVKEVFRGATQALLESMANPSTVSGEWEHAIERTDVDPSTLLVDWLSEVVYWKDAAGVVFREAPLTVAREGDVWLLRAGLIGAPVDQQTQELHADVKGVTKHRYELKQTGSCRQFITHQIRKAFATVFGQSAEALGMELVYDVAHNIAKVERYAEGELVVHRKVATRAFGPGSPGLPETSRLTGQPVICGGSMETGSYLLVGTDQAVCDTFGSTMHGSGRTMSRAQAKRRVRGEQLQQQMRQRGILVKAVSMSGLAEAAGPAYKNISEVVESVDRAGITKKVAEFRPIGNIKG